jgi:drug/metabolite transporter superfamily protein YnfA
MMELAGTAGLFALTAVAEIICCYLPLVCTQTREVNMAASAGYRSASSVCFAVYLASIRGWCT